METSSETKFYTVGIGASAGGLEALEKFFSTMPSDGNIAFVIIQHLSPDYKSHMVELLSKHTPMPVYEAEDGMTIASNSIYLLPRRKNMTIFKGKLYLVDYDRSRGLNMPIDIFLQSLAEDQGERAIGIILSGTGSDGTRGIRTIKEVGGMVMAQDETAKFDGMPRSAVATQLVDYILSPEAMPTSLLNYVRHPRLAVDPLVRPKIIDNEDMMGKLFALLQKENGVDFTGYKPNTIIRRVERRMSINQIDKLPDYVRYLQRSSAECKALSKEFLISVTRFFRDPEAFDYLQQNILPILLTDKPANAQIRVWVAGCATGEEAYSLAILLQEYMEQAGRHLDVKIFATDLDKEALEYASQGYYPASIVADVFPERLQKYFVKKGENYEISRQIRSMVVFAHQNIIKDPPFSKIDLISCRNLLIYLQPELQKKVLATFQFSLKPGGYLLLGTSETVGEYVTAFHSEHNKWKIYKSQGGQPAWIDYGKDIGQRQTTREVFGVQRYQQPKIIDDWRSREASLRALVERVMPPSVVVDDNYNVLHAFGDIYQYLRIPLGYQVNFNLLSMAQEDLSMPLSTALHRTLRDDEEVIYRNIKFQDDKQPPLNLTARPYRDPNTHQRQVLLIFEPASSAEQPEPSGEVFDIDESASERIHDLEQDLQYTKENLQATIEELETSNEELQATNEELLAANEELQSTNEELQSVNEELLTVNTEYQVKIRELTALNDDMNNLLSNTDVGVIFLDSELHLRKFTPAAQDVVNLLDQDVGRPFSHFTHDLKNFDLVQMARRSLETVSEVEQNVQSEHGTWYQIKAIPYQTHASLFDGVVLTLVDITTVKEVELLIDNIDLARSYLEAVGILVLALDERGKVTFINQAGCEILGYSKEELLGRNWFATCLPADDRDEIFEVFQEMVNGQLESVGKYENSVIRRDGQRRYINWVNTIIRDDEGNIVGTLSSGTDITEQRRAEEKFRELLEAAPDAMIIVNEDGLIKLVNQQTEKLFGYEREALLEQPVEMLVPTRFHGTHHQYRYRYLANPKTRPLDSGMALYGLHRDGTEFPVEISLSPLETETGLLILSAVRDVTERKQQDQLYRALAHNLPHGLVCLFDKNLRFTLVEGQGLAELGLSKTNYQDKTIYEAFAPENLKVLEAPYKAALEGEVTTFEFEYGGHTFLVHTTPIQDESGEISAGMVLTQDITTQKRRMTKTP